MEHITIPANRVMIGDRIVNEDRQMVQDIEVVEDKGKNYVTFEYLWYRTTTYEFDEEIEVLR